MGREYTVSEHDVESEWEVLADNHPVGATGQENKILLQGEDHEPMAILSKVPPNEVIDPHYHYEDQWQIILEGDCTIGGEEYQPYAVHYTDKLTPYGPIEAGEDGLVFMIIRNTGFGGLGND